MSSRPWAFTLPGFTINEIREEQACLYVRAQSLNLRGACPLCKRTSDRIHSYYQRTLKDLPLADHAVQLHLTVRRFRCLNPACPRKTFAESLGTLALKHAQRTQRFTSASTALGLALGGEAAARVASKLHLLTSAATLLRILRQTPLAPEGNLCRVIGIDDWAFKRSTAYGTLIVDLEQHRPVELLSDRSAEGIAAWLKHHPEIQIVARDRSTEYMRGIAQGAPQAQPVADRWHLLKNLTELLERVLVNVRSELSRLVARTTAPGEPVVRRFEKRAKNELRVRAARRVQRKARYEQVRALVAQGLTERAIAQQLHMGRNTIRKFVKAATFPEMAPHSRGSRLTPFEPYLEARWKEGCRNALQLWREIRAQGYGGTRRQVTQWACRRREEPRRFSPLHKRLNGRTESICGSATLDCLAQVAMPSAKRLAWMLVKAPEKLAAHETTLLSRLQQHPIVTQCYALAQQFTTMIRTRRHRELGGWLKACRATGIPELASFADAVANDFAAVEAALTLPWSNGQLEGQINRLKLIKRQMYGRAKFDLLRLRVLAKA